MDKKIVGYEHIAGWFILCPVCYLNVRLNPDYTESMQKRKEQSYNASLRVKNYYEDVIYDDHHNPVAHHCSKCGVVIPTKSYLRARKIYNLIIWFINLLERVGYLKKNCLFVDYSKW